MLEFSMWKCSFIDDSSMELTVEIILEAAITLNVSYSDN